MFSNPVCLAPGVYAQPQGWETLGAIFSKSVTLHPRPGNQGEILRQLGANTLINRAGLPSPGIKKFLSAELPELLSCGPPVWVSLYAFDHEELKDLTSYLLTDERSDLIEGIELNLSCPNADNIDCVDEMLDSLRIVLDAVESPTPTVLDDMLLKPGRSPIKVAVKVPPIPTTAVRIAGLVEAYGFDVVTCSNSRPYRLNEMAWGISGDSLMQHTKDTFRKVRAEIELPMIACGGARCSMDIQSYIKMGACGVQICTAEMLKPGTAGKLATEYAESSRDELFR